MVIKLAYVLLKSQLLRSLSLSYFFSFYLFLVKIWLFPECLITNLPCSCNFNSFSSSSMSLHFWHNNVLLSISNLFYYNYFFGDKIICFAYRVFFYQLQLSQQNFSAISSSVSTPNVACIFSLPNNTNVTFTLFSFSKNFLI